MTLVPDPRITSVVDSLSDSNAAPANALYAVKITTLSTAGTLTDNGVAVTAGQFISASDIASGLLVFTPAANASGASYSHWTFQVQDSGTTAGGGANVDSSARTMTVSVNSTVAAPVLTGVVGFAQSGSNVTVAVNPSITVTDTTNGTLASATVTITNFVPTEDHLSFTAVPASMGNITGSFSVVTGVLTLLSPGDKATLAQWDAALRSVTYTDTSSSPNLTPRHVAFTVSNGQATNSSSASYTSTVLTGPSTPTFASSTFNLALNANAATGDNLGVLLVNRTGYFTTVFWISE